MGTLGKGPDLKENWSPTQGPNNAQKTQGRKGTLGEVRPPNPKITRAPFEKGPDLIGWNKLYSPGLPQAPARKQVQGAPWRSDPRKGRLPLKVR